MFGINGWEALIIGIIALVVVGPDRLPDVVRQGTQGLRKAARYLRDARDSIADEYGDELSELRDFDPRQYDPRAIVRDVFNEPGSPGNAPGGRRSPVEHGQDPAASRHPYGPPRVPSLPPGAPAPFDPDAT